LIQPLIIEYQISNQDLIIFTSESLVLFEMNVNDMRLQNENLALSQFIFKYMTLLNEFH